MLKTIVVGPPSALPDLLVSHLSQALAGQSVNLSLASTLDDPSLLLFVTAVCRSPSGIICFLIIILQLDSLHLLRVQVREYLEGKKERNVHIKLFNDSISKVIMKQCCLHKYYSMDLL